MTYHLSEAVPVFVLLSWLQLVCAMVREGRLTMRCASLPF